MIDCFTVIVSYVPSARNTVIVSGRAPKGGAGPPNNEAFIKG